MKKKDTSTKIYLKDDEFVRVTDKFMFSNGMIMTGKEVLSFDDSGRSTVSDMREKLGRGSFNLSFRVYRLYK